MTRQNKEVIEKPSFSALGAFAVTLILGHLRAKWLTTIGSYEASIINRGSLANPHWEAVSCVFRSKSFICRQQLPRTDES
ncbi:hypothetical protein N9061_02775 [bacterium]|nr:hypothetical protein [Mariniblastus sp.]MDB4391905.1 hypothetical protein [bacterium]MDB4484044.1 hypothetical protein [bacterium]